MSTQYQDIYDRLIEPFPPEVVKHRPQGGRQLAYIDARDVAERLDEVLGFENWWDNYIPGEHSVQCALTIRLPDGSTVTKIDAGGYAGMQDQGDDDKSGYSDAFKRAAVKIGVGRHLYQDAKAPQRAQQRPQQPAGAARGNQAEPRPQSTPAKPDTPGRRFWKWLKDQEQAHDLALVQPVNDWAAKQNVRGKIVDWPEPTCVDASKEARRIIAAAKNRGDAYEGDAA